MLMLISDQAATRDDRDGILYRAPEQLTHTLSQTPLILVIDLQTPTVTLMLWLNGRTRPTLWLSPGFPTPEAHLRLQAPGIDGLTFVDWLCEWGGWEQPLHASHAEEVYSLLSQHRFGWLLRDSELAACRGSLQGIDYALTIPSEQDTNCMTLDDVDLRQRQLGEQLAPRVQHNALATLGESSCLLLSRHMRHVFL